MSGLWHESDISSSDESGSANLNFESVENGNVPEKTVLQDSTVGKSLCGANGTHQTKAKHGKVAAKWLSGSWPLKPFDESLPLNKRKAEWIRFRNQFERIAACKESVAPAMQLDGLKIFAGNYLLSVIEVQENLSAGSDDIYSATVSALNR